MKSKDKKIKPEQLFDLYYIAGDECCELHLRVVKRWLTFEHAKLMAIADDKVMKLSAELSAGSPLDINFTLGGQPVVPGGLFVCVPSPTNAATPFFCVEKGECVFDPAPPFYGTVKAYIKRVGKPSAT